MNSPNSNFQRNVFINCPFDEDYKPLLNTLLFTVLICGLEPRIASERTNSAEIRVQKIKDIIGESCYSVHDICRMEPLNTGDLPRFNMPFELGLDLGCRDFGSGRLSSKQCLILDKERFRYQKVLSDISGNDIKSHDLDAKKLIRKVRNWIYDIRKERIISARKIWQLYNEFYAHFEIATRELEYDKDDIKEMPDSEFIDFIKEWLSNNT